MKNFITLRNRLSFSDLFLNILVTVYLNNIIEILSKVNVSHHEYIFIRERVCWQAYDLMSKFCSKTNVDFFNELFEKMRLKKNYSPISFFVQNKSADYINLTKY